jgi:CRP-like cAMP-binding protein
MRFFPEDTMVTVLDSFLTQSPSTYSMIALEPSSFTVLSKEDLDNLTARYHPFETFFRKLTSFACLNMMGRISEMLEEDAEEGYNNFISNNGSLFQRISLGDLASYLGITQVTLSRIRAKK